jgi:EH domain-containing protein 1
MRVIALAQIGVSPSVANLQTELERRQGEMPLAKMEGLDETSGRKEDDDDFTSNPFMASPGEKIKDGRNKASNMLGGGAQTKKEKKRQAKVDAKTVTGIVDGLKLLYKTKIKPLEEAYKFGSFYGPLLTDGDFDGKPNVLLLGQYSTGKTTFIQHLLKRPYPGAHIGPEPTTDRFVVLTHGLDDRTTPGNTMAVNSALPYTGLQSFGTGFLSKFEGSQCDAELLNSVSLIDTPGVLSGEKQRIDRGYSFPQICNWFAARSDIILLLFDPYKLDISDEFKSVINALRGHDDKVRVVLNKADQVSEQQLLRVYGALMWSLGKVFMTPEVCKVYVGSFNTEPIKTDVNKMHDIFQMEHEALMADLMNIPAKSCDRKVNEFVKRTRALRTHMMIIGDLWKQMPTAFGHEKKQKKLLANIHDEFRKTTMENNLPPGDLPNPERFAAILEPMQLHKFPRVDKKALSSIEEVLTQDIPSLMQRFGNPF